MTFRATFATVARTLRDAGGWVPGFALYAEYGHRVHPIFRRLERDGLVERKEEPGGPERGGRPRALYRWRRNTCSHTGPGGACECFWEQPD